jgi:hypothetical protein
MTATRGRGTTSRRARAAEGGRGPTSDGGYYAIKGFLYQFDRTVLEMIADPKRAISFEGVQDIETDDWVVQVKHKERAKFAPSRIAKPVQSLFEAFSRDPSRRQILHCYFPDKAPSTWRPKRVEVDSLLGEEVVADAARGLVAEFARSLSVRFGENFDGQFSEVLAGLSRAMGYADVAEAAIAHSLVRSELLRRAAGPSNGRRMSLQELKEVVAKAEGTITRRGYSKYLSRRSYIRLVKKQLFTFKRPNVDAFERLVIAEAQPGAGPADLVRFVGCVARRYFRKNKSPQPYVAIRGIAEDVVREAKRAAIDSGLSFFDGTHFDGDRFREGDLVASRMDDDRTVVKWVSLDQARELARAVKTRETFQFFRSDATDWRTAERYHAVQAESLSEAVAMME